MRTVDDLGPWLVDRTPLAASDVVVLGGDLPGLGVAEQAAAKARVSRCSRRPTCSGSTSGCPGRWRRVHDLRADGITLAGGADVVEITADAVRWRDLDG